MDKDKLELKSEYKPTGDQPEAIAALSEGVLRGDKEQTLLGVTGSGKTFTMANIIANALGLEDAGPAAIPVAINILIYVYNLLIDRELLTFFDPERAITLTLRSVERTLDTLHLLTPD